MEAIIKIINLSAKATDQLSWNRGFKKSKKAVRHTYRINLDRLCLFKPLYAAIYKEIKG